MKNQEFAQKLENATTLESVMNLRNTVTAPAYIAACKEKALKVKWDYVLYSIPMSTFKKYTGMHGCGDHFSFNIPMTAKGNFKELRGLSVQGYVIEKQGGRFQNALILLKSI